MSDFYIAIGTVLKDEGGEIVADDHGRGPSRWGITLKTAQEFHPLWTAKDIYNLTRSDAVEFYRVAFWNRYNIGLLADQDIADKVLDLAINTSAKLVIETLQRVAGVPVPDGIIGPVTARQVNMKQPFLLLDTFKQSMLNIYHQIEVAHPQWQNDFAGWEARVMA